MARTQKGDRILRKFAEARLTKAAARGIIRKPKTALQNK
jgi:hypothetical protein